MKGDEQIARIPVYPFLGCCLNVQAWVKVNQGRRGVKGMCAFAVIIDALDGVIDDMIRHKDCIACSSEVGVWTRHTW